MSTLQVIVHKFDPSKAFRSFTVKLQITILFLAQRHLNIPLTGFGLLADYFHARCRIFFRCYRGFPWVLCQCCRTLCRYNRWSFRRNRCRTDVRRHRWRNTWIRCRCFRGRTCRCRTWFWSNRLCIDQPLYRISTLCHIHNPI